MASAKLSLLYLLHRIFITPKFQLTAKILGVIVASWWISFMCASVFLCTPIRANWEPDIPQHCGNRPALLLLVRIPWVATDFAILIAPLFVIKTLQLKRADKVGLCALFLTGGMYVVHQVSKGVYGSAANPITDQHLRHRLIPYPHAFFPCRRPHV